MKINKYILPVGIILIFGNILGYQAYAGFNGTIDFTNEEIKLHKDNIQSMSQISADCLKNNLEAHREFYKQNNISKFYGEKSEFAKMSDSERRNFLKERNLDPNLVEILKPTSCVGLALKCLEAGFSSTNQSATFSKIKNFAKLNDVDGQSIQYALQKLGWKILYWNPNPDKNKIWDLEEKIYDPKNKRKFRGFHEDNWVTVKNKNKYFFNSVDDLTSLVGFKDQEPEILKTAPFFIGIAHMGYHVFPGTFGQVVEAHSSRAITDPNTIESAPFNPLAKEGAPSGKYRSGTMAIPPM